MKSVFVGKPALCACFLTGLALAVGCSSQENWNKCQSTDPEVKLAGCTALIQAKNVTTANLSSVYNNRGAAYVDKRDYDRAIQDYNEAIRLNPSLAASFYGRGIAYNRKGDFDHAIEDQDEAIRLNPKFAVAYDGRGRAYRNKGDLDHAIQNYDQAIRLNPNFAMAYNNRGETLLHLGDFASAIQDFNQAIRLNSNLTSPYMNRGDAYASQSKTKEAIEDFEHVIDVAPSSESAVDAALELHIAMRRQGLEDRQILEKVATVADLSKWPGQVLKFDLGQMSADEVMTAARDGANSQWKICRANYQLGEDALFQHQRAVALTRLKAARDGCPASDGMLAAAQRELKRLGEPTTSGK
jgi:tetratricopeptide (TPR) repeat protein